VVGVIGIEVMRPPMNANDWTDSIPTPSSRLEAPVDSALISRDSEIMSGALCFTGTRVPVQNLFDYIEGQSSLEDFLDDFPSVSRGTAIAVLEAARARLFADAAAA
jgi:uncharacterized protein (DUF433 family)